MGRPQGVPLETWILHTANSPPDRFDPIRPDRGGSTARRQWCHVFWVVAPAMLATLPIL